MLTYKSGVVLGAAVAGVILGVAIQAPAQAAARNQAELVTPPGITLQEPSGRGGDEAGPTSKNTPGIFGGGTHRRGGNGYLLANDAGLTLYTYAQDTVPGHSACVAACAQASPPALVPAGVKPVGTWSTIKRDDGSRQWAYMGKPVYTSTKDSGPGQIKGAGSGFIVVRLNADDFVKRPFGVTIEEVRTVNGYALADDLGLAIYAYTGKGEYTPKNCSATVCADRWEPVAAPRLAQPTGEFTLIDRKDGVLQWAYQGKPLYTYDGDLVKGDAFGVGVDKDFAVAAVAANYQPQGAGMYFDKGRGAILSTDKGMTLYRVDFSYHNPDGHGLPGSFNGSPAVGRAMGTAPCVDECLKTWRPFAAPAKALPSGHWTILERSNGTRQWAYKGFAAYTYAGDKKAGERSGSDIYDILITNDPTIDVYQDGDVYKDDKEMKYGRRVLRTRDAAANYWAYLEP